VIDNFVGVYEKFFKHVNRKWMINILNEFEGGYKSDLDEGLEDPGVTHVSNAVGNLTAVGFNYLNGITPYQLGRICDHLTNFYVCI
jgi:hypothetical protein